MMALVFLSGVAFGLSVHRPGTALSALWLCVSVLFAVVYGYVYLGG